MARPRKGVTFDNSNKVFWYFKSIINDSFRCNKLLIDSEPYEQQRQLEELNHLSYCDIEEYQRALHGETAMLEYAKQGKSVVSPEELDKWVIKNVTKKGWQQCLSNLRQSHHASINRNKIQVKIDMSTHFGLRELAKDKNQTLGQYLSGLIIRERGY